MNADEPGAAKAATKGLMSPTFCLSLFFQAVDDVDRLPFRDAQPSPLATVQTCERLFLTPSHAKIAKKNGIANAVIATSEATVNLLMPKAPQEIRRRKTRN